jgi:hypothetical protein
LHPQGDVYRALEGHDVIYAPSQELLDKNEHLFIFIGDRLQLVLVD